MYPEDYDYQPMCEYCRFGPGPGPGGPFTPPPPRPPHGPEPGGPGGPGPGPGGYEGRPPMGPPPGRVPRRPPGAPMAIDPGSIRFCVNRYTYVWLRNGRSFWMWPTFIGRRSISGWRWNGRRWVFIGLDLRRIAYFQC